MACVWYGVQVNFIIFGASLYCNSVADWIDRKAWIGGNCMTQMLRAMWPSFWTLSASHSQFRIAKPFTPSAENTMPESSGTNTRDFVGFFLFWLISLPAIWFPIHKM